MCQQLQHSIVNLQGHDDRHEQPSTPVRRADEKEYNSSRRNLSVRKAWNTTCEQPAVHSLNHVEIRIAGGLGNDIGRDDPPCNTFTVFRAVAYLDKRGTSRLATNMLQPDHLEIVVDAMLASWGTASHRETYLTGSIPWQAVSRRVSISLGFIAGNTEPKPTDPNQAAEVVDHRRRNERLSAAPVCIGGARHTNRAANNGRHARWCTPRGNRSAPIPGEGSHECKSVLGDGGHLGRGREVHPVDFFGEGLEDCFTCQGLRG